MFRDTYNLPESIILPCKTTKPENVRKLIAWLEEGKGPMFDMGEIFNSNSEIVCSANIPNFTAKGNWCGTHACICGHALILVHLDGVVVSNYFDAYASAQHYLGISGKEGGRIFSNWKDKYSIPEAVGKLKALLESVGP